jgi:diguanylate cyclase (GGDEF)-like protein
MFDIDFFKHVNDNYGHTSGDVVLKMVAAATNETIWLIDVPARYGGEESVVPFPETSLIAAVAVAERLRKRIADSLRARGDAGRRLLKNEASASGTPWRRGVILQQPLKPGSVRRIRILSRLRP